MPKLEEIEEAREYLVASRQLMWTAATEWSLAHQVDATDEEAKKVAVDNLYHSERDFVNAFNRYHDLANWDVDEHANWDGIEPWPKDDGEDNA